MKRILLTTLITILILSTQTFAQYLTGIKLCIDPGHGGHDAANDRYIPQTGFWESDGNFDKALHAKEILEKLGAQVILTRTGNTDADDIALSQRSAIANQNNVDFFQSIHSNGFQGTSNYTLMLFRGYDNEPVFAGAKQMGTIMGNQIYTTHRTTAVYNRGDWSFYPQWGDKVGLGVLRNLAMPGVLSEGSFHDYIPESWRLLNTYYRRHEAWAIARSFLQYFNAGSLDYGSVAGIIRDDLQNVSYYYISSTNDAKKPVNNIKITIMPGELVYNGDDKNNGFYLFDSLAPGQYTIYFEAEDYAMDSSTVNVIANKTVFADKWLSEAPNYNAPWVIAHSPADHTTGVSLKPKIEIEFDIRMNTASAQSAFSISPSVGGSFAWENNNKKMIFTPSTNLIAGTEYTVTISTTARTHFNVNLENPYSFSFTTKTKLNWLSQYPRDNEEKVSTTVQVRLQFDAPIQASSLSGNIQFVDENEALVPVYVDQSAYSKGSIIFEPTQPLNRNSQYKIVVKDGIKDTEGLALQESKDIIFFTEAENYVSGSIIDGFESIGNWKDPDWSGSTTGTDPDQTTFTIATNRKVSGNGSGKINYVFTGSSGVCRVFNSDKPNIGADANTTVGLWIWGDLSYNLLEYWFYYNQTTNVIVPIDTLNWTGWKLKYIPISQIAGSGDRLFHSVVIRQTENGVKSSAVYIDDLQSNIVTGVKGEETAYLPKRFSLEQNYPNPFNPSTLIRYSIPENSIVVLKLYNILGKEVATLVNQYQTDGTYRVELNADKLNLSSGMYIYKLTAGSYSSTRKMVLVK